MKVRLLTAFGYLSMSGPESTLVQIISIIRRSNPRLQVFDAKHIELREFEYPDPPHFNLMFPPKKETDDASQEAK